MPSARQASESQDPGGTLPPKGLWASALEEARQDCMSILAAYESRVQNELGAKNIQKVPRGWLGDFSISSVSAGDLSMGNCLRPGDPRPHCLWQM